MLKVLAVWCVKGASVVWGRIDDILERMRKQASNVRWCTTHDHDHEWSVWSWTGLASFFSGACWCYFYWSSPAQSLSLNNENSNWKRLQYAQYNCWLLSHGFLPHHRDCGALQEPSLEWLLSQCCNRIEFFVIWDYSLLSCWWVHDLDEQSIIYRRIRDQFLFHCFWS